MRPIFITVIACLQFSFVRTSSCLQVINEQLNLIGSLGPVCSHGASFCFYFAFFYLFVFRFSISPCKFVILISLASYFSVT